MAVQILNTVDGVNAPSVNTVDWSNRVITLERVKAQLLDTTVHTNVAAYNTTVHNDNGLCNNHSDNSCSNHSDSTCSDHTDNAGSHDQSCDEWWQPNHSEKSSGGYGQFSQDWHQASGCFDSTTPYDRSGCNDHSNSGCDQHSNSGCDNHTDYTQVITIPHNNAGFNHQNYIPSTPQALVQPRIQGVSKVYDLVVQSFDKNVDGAGTQDAVSQTVKYIVELRKVRNADNVTSDVTAWVPLIGATPTKQLVIDPNNPFGNWSRTGAAAKGYYELRVQAVNDSITQNGVTKNYQSAQAVYTLEIFSNYDSTAAITNSADFIDNNYGIDLAEKNNILMYYQYANTTQANYDGMVVDATFADIDGGRPVVRAWLQTPGGAAVAASVQTLSPINAPTTSTSKGVNEISNALYRAYFSRALLSSLPAGDNYKVVYEFTETIDNANGSGRVVTMSYINSANAGSAQMKFTMDQTVPVVTAISDTGVAITGKTATIRSDDNLTGLLFQDYIVSKSDFTLGQLFTVFGGRDAMVVDINNGVAYGTLVANEQARITAQDPNLVAYGLQTGGTSKDAPFSPMFLSTTYNFTGNDAQWIYVRTVDNSGNATYYKSARHNIDNIDLSQFSFVATPLVEQYLIDNGHLNPTGQVPAGESFKLDFDLTMSKQNNQFGENKYEIDTISVYPQGLPAAATAATVTNVNGARKTASVILTMPSASADGVKNYTVEITKKDGLKLYRTITVEAKTPYTSVLSNEIANTPISELWTCDVNSLRFVSNVTVAMFQGTAFEAANTMSTNLAGSTVDATTSAKRVRSFTKIIPSNVSDGTYNVRYTLTLVNGATQVINRPLVISTPTTMTVAASYVDSVGGALKQLPANTIAPSETMDMVVTSSKYMTAAQYNVGAGWVNMTNAGFINGDPNQGIKWTASYTLLGSTPEGNNTVNFRTLTSQAVPTQAVGSITYTVLTPINLSIVQTADMVQLDNTTLVFTTTKYVQKLELYLPSHHTKPYTTNSLTETWVVGADKIVRSAVNGAVVTPTLVGPAPLTASSVDNGDGTVTWTINHWTSLAIPEATHTAIVKATTFNNVAVQNTYSYKVIALKVNDLRLADVKEDTWRDIFYAKNGTETGLSNSVQLDNFPVYRNKAGKQIPLGTKLRFEMDTIGMNTSTTVQAATAYTAGAQKSFADASWNALDYIDILLSYYDMDTNQKCDIYVENGGKYVKLTENASTGLATDTSLNEFLQRLVHFRVTANDRRANETNASAIYNTFDFTVEVPSNVLFVKPGSGFGQVLTADGLTNSANADKFVKNSVYVVSKINLRRFSGTLYDYNDKSKDANLSPNWADTGGGEYGQSKVTGTAPLGAGYGNENGILFYYDVKQSKTDLIKKGSGID